MLKQRLLRTIDTGLTQRAAAAPPPAWLGWLAITLMRQRARQAWHRKVVRTYLSDLDDGGGEVPGLSGWSYQFHGIGCLLCGPDGEQIDVDVTDEEAAEIDPYFFASRVRSICTRDWPEMQLWRYMPDEGLIVIALDELRDAQVISDGHLFRLAPSFEERVAEVCAISFDDRATQARWAAALGDHDDLSTQPSYQTWLVGHVLHPRNGHRALDGAAARLPPEKLREVLLPLVAGPIGAVTGKAVELMGTLADVDCDLAVRSALDRISPTEDPPYPAYAALSYLFKRAPAPQVFADRLSTFAAVGSAKGFHGNPFLGDYAVLALRYCPAIAMPLVRRALRSTTPVAVSTIAAALCAIGQPWCHRELSTALAEVHGATSSYLAEALRRSDSDLARQRARNLYQTPEHQADGGGYTFDEVLHNSVGSLFDAPLAEAKALGDQLRERFPPDWDGKS